MHIHACMHEHMQCKEWHDNAMQPNTPIHMKLQVATCMRRHTHMCADVHAPSLTCLILGCSPTLARCFAFNHNDLS